MKIKFTDWGIAYSYDDTIEINPALLKYPEYLDKVMEHEMKHIENKTFFEDFLHDLTVFSKLFSWKEWKFTFMHPKLTLQSLMPVWYRKGELNYNMFLILFYIVHIFVVFFLL